MNIFLRIALWMIGIPIALLVLLYVISGFDLMVLVYGGYILGIGLLPPLLFVASSFLCGLKGKEHLYWVFGTLLLYGAVNCYIPAPLYDTLPDPRVVYGTLYFLTIFAIAFGCGYLWRLGARHRSSFLLGAAKYLGTLCAAIVLGYISLANLGDFGGLDSSEWTEPHYNATKTMVYGRKLCLSPFPARVIGVRYYNKHGRFAGASGEQVSCCNVDDIPMDEKLDGSADILLHKQYKPIVTKLLADCKDAYRIESGKTTIYLFYKNDSLYRIEADHHDNGIISAIRNYDLKSTYNYYEMETFDELGTPQNMFLNASGYSRLWRIIDFEVEPEIPSFKYGYDNLNNPKLDKRLRKALDWDSSFKDTRNLLRAKGEEGDNLSVALLMEGFTMSKDTTISIAIEPDSRYGTDYDIGFKHLKTVEEMEAVSDALTLCRLESGIAERIIREYESNIDCPRIRIKENSERDKYVILYLLEDRAISSDFKFRFVYDPFIHTDKKKQEDAISLWKKLQQLAAEYRKVDDNDN